MPDAIFADRRLAEIYDLIDGSREDLAAYLAIAEGLGARSVLDIGCGTGCLASLFAERGIEVIGVDPAEASLEVARRKPHCERVHFVLGDLSALGEVEVDLVTMTGNVAQVFTRDEEWGAVLRRARRALGEGGHLVFETRDPARRAYEHWNPAESRRTIDLGETGSVEAVIELTEVSLPLVSFRHTFTFAPGGEVVVSDSTLSFRSSEEIEAALAEAGFTVEEIRQAPDRPGLEMVFLASAGSR